MDFKSKIGQVWYEVADHLDREDVMTLLKVVLNNCVFSFQNKFYKQLHGAAMGSPCSPVVANIYMEYFEKRALGPELPISFTINTWLRYVDDVLTIVKKGTHELSTKLLKFSRFQHKIHNRASQRARGHSFLGYFSKTFRQQNYHFSIQKTYPYG